MDAKDRRVAASASARMFELRDAAHQRDVASLNRARADLSAAQTAMNEAKASVIGIRSGFAQLEPLFMSEIEDGVAPDEAKLRMTARARRLKAELDKCVATLQRAHAHVDEKSKKVQAAEHVAQQSARARRKWESAAARMRLELRQDLQARENRELEEVSETLATRGERKGDV
ncbi:MAG: hypothetical protein AAGM38_15815 [Pseudomonadota bacterium]